MAEDTIRPLADQGTPESIPKAIVGGLVAAAIGGAVWAMIAVGTGYEIGWIAIGIGFLCGFAVRIMGKGGSNAFRGVGAATALAGIVFGKLFTVFYLASKEGVSIGVGDAFDLVMSNGSPIDLLFVGIALYEGWKFAVVSDG